MKVAALQMVSTGVMADNLAQAADLLAREVGMNRKLLREALTSTDQHVRTLVGAPAQPTTYATEGAATASSSAPRGVLVNRTA